MSKISASSCWEMLYSFRSFFKFVSITFITHYYNSAIFVFLNLSLIVLTTTNICNIILIEKTHKERKNNNEMHPMLIGNSIWINRVPDLRKKTGIDPRSQSCYKKISKQISCRSIVCCMGWHGAVFVEVSWR